MPFVTKVTKRKHTSCYKTVYMPQELADQVQAIAEANDTSFNNVVISMIESCLQEEET